MRPYLRATLLTKTMDEKTLKEFNETINAWIFEKDNIGTNKVNDIFIQNIQDETLLHYALRKNAYEIFKHVGYSATM